MSGNLTPNSAVNRGKTVLGTNSGSYAPKTNSAPGAGAALAPVEPVAAVEDVVPPRQFADAKPIFTEYFGRSDEARERRLAAFKAELDEAVASLDQDEQYQAWLDCVSQFHRYSFNNQMLIWMQSKGRATRVAKAGTWEKLGRRPNKGEKAMAIYFPYEKKVDVLDANGQPVLDENGQPKKRVWTQFSLGPVFDVSQTNGEPLPEIDRELSEEPPEGFVDDMIESARNAGYSVEFREMDSHAKGTAQGWTNPQNKTIVVDASLTPGSQAATLAHELGHVYAGHCERLGEYHTGNGGCRGEMETAADSVSYALLRSVGMKADGGKLSAQYIKGWSKNDPDALRRVSTEVSKATKAILHGTKFRNAEYDKEELEAHHQRLVAEGKVKAPQLDENGNPVRKRRVTKKRPAKKAAAKRTVTRRKSAAASTPAASPVSA